MNNTNTGQNADLLSDWETGHALSSYDWCNQVSSWLFKFLSMEPKYFSHGKCLGVKILSSVTWLMKFPYKSAMGSYKYMISFYLYYTVRFVAFTVPQNVRSWVNRTRQAKMWKV